MMKAMEMNDLAKVVGGVDSADPFNVIDLFC